MEISVVMSVYNERPEQVQQAISSILRQTYLPTEFIIVLDDPNQSDLKALLQDYDHQTDIIKLVLNRENIGLAASLNKAIELASNELIARMDADDISEPRRLELELDELKRRHLDLVSGNIAYMDENGIVTGGKSIIPEDERLIAKLLPYGSTIIHPTVLMRKSAIEQVGGYRLLPTAEDYDLWLRMLASGLKIGSINAQVLKYRLRDNSMTSNAWKTYIVSRYIQKLYAQRKRIGHDTFKSDDYDLFAKINDEPMRQKFNRGQYHFELAMYALRNKKIAHACYRIIKAMFTTKNNFQFVINYLSFRVIWFASERVR
ncbi:glycosyltransferase [Lactiplantibacillus pentosus]|uniref:Glycosyltransferase n=3 Tax=Lactiplantibacillus pentosus TaxID=1589 RepID=A0AAX6L9V1_LACPE|nr:glycosyltransferase [Lactiplantibacillus pentosus]AYJ42192.1 glycosyltransferase [Lactiplantibacillus pentosus]MCC3163118.1 glycosyltransferase [Lactiplantibacillus pentosus]MCJ8188295.1 glycosyltransferase [Lactiplantibacillus pentosus]MCT3296410.1 glycosyltransferase [Lactiplantibacillus pentosus]MCT3312601.1 glycosyltransferase [Lactiplantibacillus pentosus]